MSISQFVLTPQPIRASATGKQAMASALPVAGYTTADTYLYVPALEGATPSITVRLIGGWQTETEDGWMVIATYNAVSASSATPQRLVLAFLPPYLRWEVSAISGTSPVAAFTIVGSLSDQ